MHPVLVEWLGSLLYGVGSHAISLVVGIIDIAVEFAGYFIEIGWLVLRLGFVLARLAFVIARGWVREAVRRVRRCRRALF